MYFCSQYAKVAIQDGKSSNCNTKLEWSEDAGQVSSDCDLYSSTKTVFDNIYDRIVPNTVIQFDEYYNYPGWRNHEFKAFQEFCKKYSVEYEYIGISLYQVAVVIKSIKN